ncbi:SGNH/GDSL hydrolase family protein [Hydrogenophaga defluvii]|uniref:SGNH/GDSL hydrolase family protein n=1 Tax=Hydrogenophaga defluvii TaxID=249410 RepID=A0ABW2S7V3_9BURK
MKFRLHLAALATALLLAACGGGDPAITSVKVMGDSLADSGTFGLKFTVQGSAGTGAGSTPIWPELVAQELSDADALCAYNRVNPLTQAATVQAGCTNYAVGGGRIHNVGNPQDPRSITLQLQQAAQVHGSYKSTDLLLVDGGGNDAADLAGAYLGATTAQGQVTYRALLISLLPAATVDALLGQLGGPEQAGGTYMQALADTFHDSIKASALDKGASKVVVLNLPDITLTPRFQAVLAGVTQQAGAAAAQQAQGLIRQWIVAFNTRLASRFAGNAQVAVVDFYATLTDQVANPGKYGLTNAVDTACPVVGVGSDGLPSYNFLTCTASALSANLPAGVSGGANWWKTYLYSDSFHPTPYGHELLADAVAAAVRAKNWD